MLLFYFDSVVLSIKDNRGGKWIASFSRRSCCCSWCCLPLPLLFVSFHSSLHFANTKIFILKSGLTFVCPKSTIRTESWVNVWDVGFLDVSLVESGDPAVCENFFFGQVSLLGNSNLRRSWDWKVGLCWPFHHAVHVPSSFLHFRNIGLQLFVSNWVIV